MGFFNFSKANEIPLIKPQRVPSEKNDGYWAPSAESASYENRPEILEKIRAQRAKEFSEINRRLEESKN